MSVLPDPDEVEVSVFGRGIGEAVAVHLGGGEWILVDSFLDENGEPAALGYLRRIGVPPSAVSLVVVTHWHDDHTGGIADVFEACQTAELAWPACVPDKRFWQSAFAYRNETPPDSPAPLEEFLKLFKLLGNRQPKTNATVSPHVLHASESTTLLSPTFARPSAATVSALSPSNGAVTRFLASLAHQTPGKRPRALSFSGPNDVCVVLHIQCGDIAILLGSDMENRLKSPAYGWPAIVRSPSRPSHRATIYKVAHHGSEQADDHKVWSQLLTSAPIAVVTPFTRSRLPTESDRQRLSRRPGRCFLAGNPKSRSSALDRATRTALDLGTTRWRHLDGRYGHVRVRCSRTKGGSPKVERFGATQTL